MNDGFGNISSDFLPPGYGDIPGKVQQRVDADPPTMEHLAENEYGKLFGEGGKISGLFSKKDDSGSSTSTGSTTTASAPVTTTTTLPTEPRELKGKQDKYVYLQYPDNSVDIVYDPTGGRTGKHYSATSDWGKGVINIYGEHPGGETVTTTSDSGGGLDSFLVGLGSSTSSSSNKGANIGAGIGAAAAQLLPALAAMLGPQDVTPYDDEADAGTDTGSSAGIPWGLVFGGLAVVGGIGGVIYFATRDSDDEE